MSSKKIKRKTQGPPPRAGFGCDAILERGGQVVNIRKLYVGPSGLDPGDLTEILSAVVAATMINAIPDAETLMESKSRLFRLLDERIQPIKQSAINKEPAHVLTPAKKEEKNESTDE